jgi:hypothetical protein
LSSPSLEIRSRTSSLFNNMDKLAELTLILLGEQGKDSPESVKATSGNVLRILKEDQIRKVCGEMMYRAGAEVYTLGDISELKFAENTLLGRIVVGGRKKSTRPDDKIQSFQPIVTLERNSRAIRTFGECQCALAKEGTICPHMAALMIAWARGSREFKEDSEYLGSKFEKAKQKVRDSLDDLVASMQTGTDAENFELLQKVYAKIRRWRDAVKEMNRNTVRGGKGDKKFDPIRELSGTINYVSLAILAAVERRYKLRTIDIYNEATLTGFGKVLELFVEGTRFDSKLLASSSLPRKEGKVSRTANASSDQTKRSWDVLIENFSGAS